MQNSLLQIKNNLTDQYTIINVVRYSVDYDKIWGSSVKNMEGSTRATLVGIIPVIKATTEYVSQIEIRSIGALLNQSYMYVKFYDSISGTTQEEIYTASDISADMFRENGKQYEGLSFVLTPVDTQGVVS